MTLYFTGLSELYREIEALGDPSTGISDRIDFERIRLILPDLHENDTEKSGRPNYDPVLMILDEPSGGLSPVYVEKIIDSMAMLKKSGKSILLAEQNVEFITLADKLYVMDFGRISFSGNPNQAVQDDAIKKAYFNL